MRLFSDNGRGVNEVYTDMIWAIMGEGELIGTDWHGAADKAPTVTRELHPATIEISNIRRKLVTSRVINVTFALAEVLWILLGRDDVDMLQHYNSNIDSFSDNGDTFNAAYGRRMRISFGVDQLDDVVHILQRDPNSRQATIVLSDPRKDSSIHITKDRACNVLSHLMIRGGKLDWMQIIRSNDAVWGTPYNWMQWMHMQEYVADRLGVEPGSYYHVVDSLHIYEHHFAEANTIKHNDLYDILGEDHPPFVQYNLQTLQAMEADIRLHGSVAVAMNLPACWQVAMGMFIAHKHYKNGQNRKASSMLANVAIVDPIYAAAQARFYWQNRWHKIYDGDFIAALWPKETAHWIMDV